MPAFVIFEVATRSFAIPADRVLQIARAAAPAALAGAPDIVRGVLDIHGDVVPVLDARAVLGAPRERIRASDQLLVVDAEPRFALLVDRVLDVREVPESEIDRGVARTAGAELSEGALKLTEGAVVIQSPQRWALLAAGERGATLQ